MIKKQSSTLKLPVFDGQSGLVAGIDPLRNSPMLDAAGDVAETRYLLSEPANAEHLLRSIKQHRQGKTRVIRKLRRSVACGVGVST